MNFKQPFCLCLIPSVSFLIRSFEILHSNRLCVSSLIPLFEMSKNAFQFNRITSDPYKLGSDPIRSHETFLGSDPNGITFESDPVWVRIADPNGFGSVEFGVNARPIRYILGIDPFASDLVKTGPRCTTECPTKIVPRLCGYSGRAIHSIVLVFTQLHMPSFSSLEFETLCESI